MSKDLDIDKPSIDFEEAMRLTHDRFDGLFKALAELEKRERELAEKESAVCTPRMASKDDRND